MTTADLQEGRSFSFGVGEGTPPGQLPRGPYADWRPTDNADPPGEPYIEARCSPCCQTANGCGPCAPPRAVVPATQPVVPVPVHQEILRKDRIVEVPQTIVTDKVIPRVFQQEVHYDVPQVSMNFRNKPVAIPEIKFVEKVIEIPVPVGYNYKVIHKWEIREVPRLVPKYVGKSEEIPIEVPQVQILDKQIEKEVPVYVGERLVKKEVVEEEPVETIEYQYVQEEEEVPVYKYKPVLDVQVDIPPPLLVPIPTKPEEKTLPPEILSLKEWKRLKRGAAHAVCSEDGACGANSDCVCSGLADCLCVSCRPAHCCSPGGFCGNLARCECRDALETCCTCCKTCPCSCQKGDDQLIALAHEQRTGPIAVELTQQM